MRKHSIRAEIGKHDHNIKQRTITLNKVNNVICVIRFQLLGYFGFVVLKAFAFSRSNFKESTKRRSKLLVTVTKGHTLGDVTWYKYNGNVYILLNVYILMNLNVYILMNYSLT